MEDIQFQHVVFFDENSAQKFSTFRNEAKKQQVEGRDLVAKTLSRKKGIKELFKEMPGGQGVFIYNTPTAQPTGERDNHVLPVADMEAMGVEKLSSEQIGFLEEHGAKVIPNAKVRRLTHVNRMGLGDTKPNRDMAWQLSDVLNGASPYPANKGVRVGVVDTGVNTKHSEFQGQRLAAARIRGHRIEPLVGPDGDLLDHGTSVASVIGGRNLGVCRNVDLAVCDVFEDDEGAKPLDILQGISWLKNNPFGDGRGVDIINLSLGVEGYNDVFREAIAEALQFDGILFVAAIGNDGHRNGPCCSPGCYNEVLSVGAYDRELAPAEFSNCGKARQNDPAQPDIWAPGVQVYAATANGTYDAVDGTSFSAPIVSAVAARIIASNPEYKHKPSKVLEALLEAAEENPKLLANKRMARASV